MAPSDALEPAAEEPVEPAAAEEPAAEQVLVTISKTSDGGYMVRAGDEPEAVAPAEGEAAVAQPGAEPIMAANIGEALKAALEILQADGGGDTAAAEEEAAEGEFEAGFSESKDPKLGNKY